jgi:hypothetical protein
MVRVSKPAMVSKQQDIGFIPATNANASNI